MLKIIVVFFLSFILLCSSSRRASAVIVEWAALPPWCSSVMSLLVLKYSSSCSLISVSIIFSVVGRMLMGRNELRLLLGFPAFFNGITRDVLNILGNLFELTILLNK